MTYLSLVVRRVWAKRGILVGSFLGATFVTALLVIVPLYEDSVRAVDLRFTLQGASADEVDVQAFANSTAYDGVTAAGYRDLVEEQRVALLGEWYPTTIERSQSRELIVIPVEGGVDWLGQAAQWRADLDEALAAEVEDEALPLPPYPTPPPEATQVRLFTSPSLVDIVDVVAGAMPPTLRSAPGDEGGPLPIILGANFAETIRREPGDVFVLRPFSGFRETFEIVEVAAIVEPTDGDAKVWGLDDPGSMVYLDQATFDAWTGVISIDPDADPWRRPTRGFVGSNVTQRFILDFDPSALDLEEIDRISVGVNNYRAELAKETGGAVAANTSLPILLNAFDVRSVVVGAPILAMLALVVGAALYFLVYTASLTLEREGPEMALLRTRGASAWQTVGIHLGQSLLVTVAAVLIAPFVARSLVGLTGQIPPMSDLTGGESLSVKQVRSLVPFLVGGAAVTFVSMGLAIVPMARRSVLELRSMAARPTKSSVWQRYNLDLFALALSLVILWQISQRGFIDMSGDEAELDALAIVFPVLLLFTGALVLLRVLPWLLRLVGWLMTKSRRMALALPGWHLGRNPVPYGRLALLVWLTTGFGAFALTYANTLNSSFDDRAAFAVGSDVRIVDDRVGFLDPPEGVVAASVLRTDGAPRQSSRRAEVLAVQPNDFSSVVTWRGDFGGSDPGTVFGPLRPDGAPPDLGIEFPSGATALRVDGLVIPRTWAEKTELGQREPDSSLRLLAKVFDAKGQVWTMQASEDFVDSGWSTVEIDLTDGLDRIYAGDPVAPLILHTMWVERSKPSGGSVINGERLLVDAFRVVTPDSEQVIDAALDELSPINGLLLVRDVDANEGRDSFYSQIPQGEPPPTDIEFAESPLSREGTATRWVLPRGRNRLNPAVPQMRRIPDPLRVLLDREAASIAGLNVGDDSSYSVGGSIFSGTVVGFIDEVPTMVDRRRQGRMVVDLDAVSAWLNGTASWSFNTNLARVEAPGELWIRADDTDAAIRRVLAQFPANAEPDQVLSIKASAADFSGRPVQVGLVSILFVGAATSVALALAGVTGYVLLAVSRRAREMGVLRALGFQRKGVAATFAVEQVAVLGLGALIGTVGGIALMRTMISFLQLGETAEEIVPSVRLDVDWAVLLGYLGVVGVLLIASVVWATRRVSVRRMSEVLREVER